MASQSAIEFDAATYFDAGNKEVLEHESVAAALAAQFDEMCEPSIPIIDDIARLAPFKVKAYRRAAIGPEHIDRWTNCLIDHLDEMIGEEEALCDPETGETDVSGDVVRSVRDKLRPLVEEYAKDVSVWHCDYVGERIYDAAEVEAILRKQEPHWFDRKLGGAR